MLRPHRCWRRRPAPLLLPFGHNTWQTTWILYGLVGSQLCDKDNPIEGFSGTTTVSQFMEASFGYEWDMIWWCCLIVLACEWCPAGRPSRIMRAATWAVALAAASCAILACHPAPASTQLTPTAPISPRPAACPVQSHFSSAWEPSWPCGR